MMSDILLFEPDHERARRIIFLLKLAEIRCTHVKSYEETLNYISAQRLNVISFDLLLLGSSEGMAPDEQLYHEVSNFSAIPVVYAPLEDCHLIRRLPKSVIICDSDDLLNCVKNNLNS